jgi:hypothetical protein
MPDFYIAKQYVEDQLSTYKQRFVPLALTTSASIRQLTVSDPTLIIVSGSASGYNIVLPNATTLENGYYLVIHCDTTTTVDIDYFGGLHYIQMAAGSRMSLYLELNTTAAGKWIRAIQSSSPFTGTSPVLATYNGNAGVGRYLEIFSDQSSDTAPFYVPTNAYIVAFELSTLATSTVTVGIFAMTDLVNPIYSITLTNGTTIFGTNLTVALAQAQQIAFRITAAVGNVSKPRIAMYFTGY